MTIHHITRNDRNALCHLVPGNTLIRTAGLLLMLGSIFLQAQAFGQDAPGSFGYLQVFSATQELQWGEGSYYHPHTGYRIYDSTNKMVKWVENHMTSTDEDPQKVELASGTYTIWAQSEKDGYVKVPVMIKQARTTTIDLENGRSNNKQAPDSAGSVKIPCSPDNSAVLVNFLPEKNPAHSWNK